MNYLARLENLHPDIVTAYLEKGISKAIPQDLQEFIQHIQWAAEIWETERNTTRAARKLKQRIQATHGQSVSLTSCKERLYASMEYFDINHNLPQQIWDRNAADKFEDLAKLAIASDKLDAAGRFLDKANELRRRANSEMNPDDIKAPMFLITTEISAEDLGYSKENLKKIAKKAQDGFYLELINKLPVDKKERKRLMSDADIQDVEFQEMEYEPTRDQ